MKYTIYKITNLKNGKIYIGKHVTTNPYDGYYGSGKAIEAAIKEYGKENFHKDVLYIYDNKKDMDNKERELVNESFISTNKTYNMGLGGEGGAHFRGKTHNEETRKKLSILAKGRVFSNEARKKISDANKKRVISDVTRKKLSDKAKLRTPETRKKVSDTLKEKYKLGEIKVSVYKRTEIHRKQLSEKMKSLVS